MGNMVQSNDMGDLQIRAPDGYSDNHIDGRMFYGSNGVSSTANAWLNEYTEGNVVTVKVDETVIDDGTENEIIHK